MENLATNQKLNSSPPVSRFASHRKKSPEQVARKRSENSYKVGVALENSGDAVQQAKAIISKVFDADPKANGVLHNYEDKKGREYICSMSFDFTHWRLSDTYQRKQARRHRNVIYKAFMSWMDDIKAHNLEVCFFTPTYPNLQNVGFTKNSEFHGRAWELFLKNPVCGEFFLGGYSRVDFTEKSKTDVVSINYHNHALTILIKELAFGNSFELETELARLRDCGALLEDKRPIINSLRIAKVWTNCLKQAHQEIFGKAMKVNSNSGNCRVDFKNVDVSEIENYTDEAKKGILFELAGYTAKQADFVGLLKNDSRGAELLSEAEIVFRNKRILTGFGVFRAKKSKAKEQKSSDESSLLKGEHTAEKTTPKSDLNDSRNCGYPTRKSILKIGIEMIEAGKKAEWERDLHKLKNFHITKRRNRLLEHFPNAVFTDLSGNRFYGGNVRQVLQDKIKETVFH